MNKHTILIVDDNPDNLQILFDYLQDASLHYSIIKAISGKMACQIIEKRLPDLVVTDWDMPGMDGIELIKWLRNNPKTGDIPVIIATGVMTTINDLQTAFEAGAVDYIRKPVDPIELQTRARSMLKLADSMKEIKLLNAAKDRFFSIIAHDLSGPLNGILGFSDLLISDFDQYSIEKVKEYIGGIYEASRNGYNLLHNLLEWSRSQMSLILYKPQPTIIKQVVDATLELLNTNIKGKQINISTNIDPELCAFADLNMINSVMLNLINNAIKFTYPGGSVTISAKQINELIQLTVSDTGVGISEVQKAKLFKIEESSKTQGTNNEWGTGLGLILCKEFIERNGGSIWVESEKGTGSSFIFTLPCCRKDSE